VGAVATARRRIRRGTGRASPELLSPLIGEDKQPDQQVRQIPAFVGIGDSGRSDISEHVDELLAGGFGE
jgi:hypothetical protein